MDPDINARKLIRVFGIASHDAPDTASSWEIRHCFVRPSDIKFVPIRKPDGNPYLTGTIQNPDDNPNLVRTPNRRKPKPDRLVTMSHTDSGSRRCVISSLFKVPDE